MAGTVESQSEAMRATAASLPDDMVIAVARIGADCGSMLPTMPERVRARGKVESSHGLTPLNSGAQGS